MRLHSLVTYNRSVFPLFPVDAVFLYCQCFTDVYFRVQDNRSVFPLLPVDAVFLYCQCRTDVSFRVQDNRGVFPLLPVNAVFLYCQCLTDVSFRVQDNRSVFPLLLVDAVFLYCQCLTDVSFRVQDEYLFEWSDSGGMDMDGCISGGVGVPIPRSQVSGGLIHTNSNVIMSRPPPLLPASIASSNSQFSSHHLHHSADGGGSSSSPYLQQSSLSPQHHIYQHSPSPAGGTHFPHQQGGINYTDSMGLSPLPPNSPSPHMWQTQSMDLETDFDIKMEPFEEMIALHNGNEINLNSGVDSLDFLNTTNDSIAMNMYFDNLMSESQQAQMLGHSSGDTTCLDPQHSSPAAMAAIRPNEVLGMCSPGNHSVSSFSQLLLHSSPPQQQHHLLLDSFQHRQQQQQLPLQQQSHSFTATGCMTNALRNGSNLLLLPGSVNSSAGVTSTTTTTNHFTSGGSMTHLSSVAVKQELNTEALDSLVVSSFPPPYCGLRDPFLGTAGTSLPAARPRQQQGQRTCKVEVADLHELQPHHLTQKMFPSEPATQQSAIITHAVEQQRLQQRLEDQQQQQMIQQQKQQELQHQQLLLQRRLEQQVLQHNNQLSHQINQNQINKSGKPKAQYVQQQQSTQIQRQLAQQLLRRQQQQVPTNQTSPMQQQQHGSLSQHLRLDSFSSGGGSGGVSPVPITPNNTPIMSNLPMLSTLKEMLQSPSTSLSSPISPQSICSPISATSPLPTCSPRQTASPSGATGGCPPEDALFGPTGGASSPYSVQHPGHSPQYVVGGTSPNPVAGHSPHYVVAAGGTVARLSSSAPAHNMLEQIWGRREPRRHLLSTGSLAEEQQVLGGSSSSLNNSESRSSLAAVTG